MTEELEIVQNKALVPQTHTGVGNYQIVPNPMVIVQPVSQDVEGIPLGAFYDTISKKVWYNENLKCGEIKLVPLFEQENRVLFPPNSNFGDDPLCKSNNGLVPISGELAKKMNLVPQSDACQTYEPESGRFICSCEHASWAKYRTEGIVPDCQQKFRMWFIDREDLLPYVMNFGGKAVKPFRQFMQSIARDMKAELNKTGTVMEIYDYTFTLTTFKNVDKKGSYWLPKFSEVKRVKERGMFKAQFDEYMGFLHNPSLASDPVNDAIEGQVVEV